MRALIVADDASAALRAQTILATQTFICDTAGLDEDAVAIAKLYDHDVIILSVSAEDGGGCELVRQLRAAGVRKPILVIAAAIEIDLKIRCLGFGADDVLTKPYDHRELIARVKAIIRRANGHAQSVIRTGKLAVNLDTRIASVDDVPLALTNKEYCVLEVLSLRKGVVVTKEAFLNHLYGGMDEPGMKIIDVFVCKLRQKLAEATGGRHYIQTVHGRGYVMRDPVSRVPADASGGGLGFRAPHPGSTARAAVLERQYS